MKTKEQDKTVQGFSTVQMKQELQEDFQRKTAGMSFKELRCFLDQTLDPLPQERKMIDKTSKK